MRSSAARLIREYVKEVVGDYSLAGAHRTNAPGNVRAGQAVVGSRRNVLSDLELMSRPASQTVRVVVRRPDGRVLVVVDQKDSFHIGLPGGGVEAGEDLIEAAKRELEEETGLVAGKLVRIRTDQLDDGSMVTLFVASGVKGKLRGSDEGGVDWVVPDRLLTGKFSDYYNKVFDEIRML